MTKPTRTYVSLDSYPGAPLRLYSDGVTRLYVGDVVAHPGNGSDVAPGEKIVPRPRLQIDALSPEDRATYDAWRAEQDEYRRQAGY